MPFFRYVQYTLVAGLRQTSEDLKLARGCLPLAPFFKTPQFYGVCRASTRSEQCCRPPRSFLGFLVSFQFLENFWKISSSPEIELSGATKSGSRGGVFEAPDSPEEATMARQPFQEHLKGRKIGVLKFCGNQQVCGKAELPRDFSVLGFLLQPNRRVFLQESSWTTCCMLMNPVPRPSYRKSTSQNFALWAQKFIKSNV